jgi:C-terminal processing protease CtpA/Prc
MIINQVILTIKAPRMMLSLILDTLKRENVDGIVIDLRENGGGSLMEAIDLTGLFIKTGSCSTG